MKNIINILWINIFIIKTIVQNIKKIDREIGNPTILKKLQIILYVCFRASLHNCI